MDIFRFFPAAGFLVMAAIIVSRLVSIKAKGVKVGTENSFVNPAKAFLFLLFFCYLLLFLSEIIGLVVLLPFSLVPGFLSTAFFNFLLMKAFGSAVIVFSLFLLWITFRHFKSSLRFGLNKNNLGKLITSGIFSVSRNPFFLSVELFFIGVALIFPSLFFIATAVFSIVGIHFFILKEEKFMIESYGESYSAYRKKVPRYFGFGK